MRIPTASTYNGRAIILRRHADSTWRWTYADTGFDLHVFDTAREAAIWERTELRKVRA